MSEELQDGWYWVKWPRAGKPDWSFARYMRQFNDWQIEGITGYCGWPKDIGPRIPTPDDLTLQAAELTRLKGEKVALRKAGQKLIDGFHYAQRAYGDSLFTTGAGYHLKDGYDALVAALLADPAAAPSINLAELKRLVNDAFANADSLPPPTPEAIARAEADEWRQKYMDLLNDSAKSSGQTIGSLLQLVIAKRITVPDSEETTNAI